MRIPVRIHKTIGLLTAIMMVVNLILFLPSPAYAAAIWTVTDSSDTDGSAADITLRYAMVHAQSGDTINFADSVIGQCYYTTDGSDPITSSTRIAYDGLIPVSQTETIKAVNHTSAGWSAVTSATFNIGGPDSPREPMVFPYEGSFTGSQTVYIYGAGASTLYYTTDGSDPGTSSTSTTYQGEFTSITVSQSGTVKVIAQYGSSGSSNIASATFTIGGTASLTAPVITPNGGSFSGPLMVDIYNRCGTIYLSSPLPKINKDLTIKGPGADSLSISGNYKSRIFEVDGGTVSISGIIIENGFVRGNTGYDGNNGIAGGGGGGGGAAEGGGGLLVKGGTVTIDGINFLYNKVVGGSGGSGGAGYTGSDDYGDGGNGATSDLYGSSAGGHGGIAPFAAVDFGIFHLSDARTGYDATDGVYYGGGGGGSGINSDNESSGYSWGGQGGQDVRGTSGAGPNGGSYNPNGSKGGNGGCGGAASVTGGYYYGGNGGNGGDAYGGAVCVIDGGVQIMNSSFTGNSAIGGMGGAGGLSYQGMSNGQDLDSFIWSIGSTMLSGNRGSFEFGSFMWFVDIGLSGAGKAFNYSAKTSVAYPFGGYPGNGGNGEGGAIYVSPYSGSYTWNNAPVVIVNSAFSDNGAYGGSPGPVTNWTGISGSYGQNFADDIANKTNSSYVDLRNVTGADSNLGDIRTLSGPSTMWSRVTASSYSVTADGTSSTTITVLLHDSNNMAVWGDRVTLNQGSGHSKISPASAITDNDGYAVFTVTDTKAETIAYTVTDAANVTISGRNILIWDGYKDVASTESTVVYTPGPSNAANSAASASPSTVSSNGIDSATVTVTIKDAGGNLLSGKTVTLSQGAGHSHISPASAITDSSGMVTFTVTNTYDETVTYSAWVQGDNVTVNQTTAVTFSPYDWNVYTLNDGNITGTLRYAIENAPPGTTITFQKGLSGTILLSSPLPAVSKDLVIDGSGASITIDGRSQYRIFQVDGGIVSIMNLTLADGSSIGTDGADSIHTSSQGCGDNGGDGTRGAGGALLINNGTVAVNSVVFNNNRAAGGNGGKGSNGQGPGSQLDWGGNGGNGGLGSGGAIALVNGSLTVSDSSFSGNQAAGGNGGTGGSSSDVGGQGGNAGSGFGGAIYAGSGTLTINNCQFSGSSASGGNGGSAGSCGPYSIGGAIGGNGGSGFGGFIYSGDGTVTVTGAQFSGGSVTAGAMGTGAHGNGIAGSAAGLDIYNQKGTVSVGNVTFDTGDNSYYNPFIADAGKSSVTTSSSVVYADGSAASTITVTLKRADGSPVSGKTVVLSQGNGSSNISPSASAVSDNNGVATFTVTDSLAEMITYTVTDATDYVTLKQTAKVYFYNSWMVNSLADTNAPGTLRYSISSAPSGSTIVFQNGLSGTILLQSSLPVINKDLIIDGYGADVTISGNNQYRVFEVDGGAVSIKNITIAGGKAFGSKGADAPYNGYVRPQPGGSGGSGNGGGLLVTGGTVNIEGVSFNDNQAAGGNGGICGDSAHYNYYAGPGLHGGNGGSAYGGAICLTNGLLTISGSQFYRNSAAGGNGGSSNWSGSYGGNGGSAYGGAIYVNAGSLTITDSQFFGNSVTNGSGGSGISMYGNGGGNGSNGSAAGNNIYNQSGTTSINNVTYDIPADGSTVTASPSGVTADGLTTSTITVTLRDVNGNPLSGKTVALSQGAGSSSISPASAITGSNGAAVFTVADTKAETVTYTANDNTDNMIIAQTTTVTFIPPDADKSTVTASPSSVVADGLTASAIAVTLLDANLNPVRGKTVVLSQGSGNSTITPVNNGLTDSGGIAAFTVTDIRAEAVTYTVRDTTDDVTITQSIMVTFTTGAVDAAQSVVTASPKSVMADGLTTSTIAVTLKDATGNPVSGRMITLSQGAGNSNIIPVNNGLTDSNGTATFTVTDTQVETVTYTAVDTTDNVTVSQTASVEFSSNTRIVSSTSDDGSPGTLRYAMQYAASGNTIAFQKGLSGTITLQSPLPVINKDLIIDGTGAGVTISGNSRFRVFEIDSGRVDIKGLIIADGMAVGSNGTRNTDFYTKAGAGGIGSGGGLLITGGTVYIDNVTFNNNRAIGGNGGNAYYGYGGDGGNGEGGAVFATNGSLTVTNSVFMDNEAIGGLGSNGDVYASYGGNGGSGVGGAIFIDAGPLTITNSSFSGDSVAGGSGGSGIRNDAAGYGGSGSSGSANGASFYSQSGTVVLSDVTLDSGSSACYSAFPFCTVTFDSQGGSPVSSISVTSGSTISAPAAPTQSGYSFGGWYKEAACTNEWDFSTDTVTGDITLYAKWTVTHTVTFKDWDGTIIKTETVNNGAGATAPENPIRTGYTFTGWDVDFSNVTSDLTVTAQFSPITYTVTYNGNGGTGAAPTESDKTAGAAFTAAANSFTAPGGKQFKEWNTNAGGTGTEYAAGVTVTMPSGNLILYAIWEDIPAVTLQSIAITTPANKATYTVGETLDITGMVVTGTYSDNSTKAESITAANVTGFDSSIPSASQTLTVTVGGKTVTYTITINAVTYIVTFKNWDDSLLKTETVVRGSAAIAPTNPTRAGYTFTGWDKDFSNVASDLTVNAQYSKNSTPSGGGDSSNIPPAETTTVTGSVIDNASGAVTSSITATVTVDSSGHETISMDSSQILVLREPDGNISPLVDVSKAAITGESGTPVTAAGDGIVQLANLNKGTDNHFSITYDLGNGQKVTIGTMEIQIDSSGNVSITVYLIDPYGIISDAVTGKAIDGVNVTLYYADTARNKTSGKTPDTVVQLPAIDGFRPNNNKNPQVSDISGAYGFMVFPNTDYYIVADKEGYFRYISPTISVEKEIVKWDFSMRTTQVPEPPVITLPAPETTNDRTPEVRGTGEPGNTVTIYDKGVSIGTAVVGQEGTWSFTPSVPLEDGVHQISATQTNAAGNVSNSSSLVNLTIKTGIERISGQDRIDTAIEIAKASFTGGVSSVVLATSEDYPDALAGSVLAYKFNAPILLVGSSDTDQQKVIDYMESNMDIAGTVYILGGAGAVSRIFEGKVNSAGFKNIIRIGGADRYETAVKISDSLDVKTGTPIVLVSGENYPDGLSVSSASAVMQMPILLVQKDCISQAVKEEIARIKPSKIYIIGLEGAISSTIENEAAAIASIDKSKVIRIGGQDRYETSIKVAEYFNLSGQSIFVATGENFPDALAGSVYSAKCSAPIILADGRLSDAAVDYLKTRKITYAAIFGGEGAISKNIDKQLLQVILGTN